MNTEQQASREYARALTLTYIAPRLPDDLKATAFNIARGLRDEAARVRALSGLARSLPDAERDAVLHEALDIARSISNGWLRPDR